MAAMVLCKATERYRARAAGEEPPPYTQAEIEHMRESDLETVAGGGAAAGLRDNPGWQSEVPQGTLDEWEEGARRRLEEAKDLPPNVGGRCGDATSIKQRKNRKVLLRERKQAYVKLLEERDYLG